MIRLVASRIVLLVLVLMSAACGHSSRDDAKRVQDALSQLPSEARPVADEAARPPSGAGNQYEVYMDISASMRPFFHPKTVAESNLRTFLRRLGNLSPSRLKTFAFCTPSASTPLPPTRGPTPAPASRHGQPPPWEMPLGNWFRDATYSGLFNDYAPLMKEFQPGAVAERLVVSDGVLSSQASEASFLGATAGEINRWINDGGVFALFLFRAPYYCDDARGPFSYFSETLREEHKPVFRVAYNTDKRPFAIFAFLHSEAALNVLKSELIDDLGGGTHWSLEIRPPALLRPLEVEWASDLVGKGVQKRMETLEVNGVPGGVVRCPLPPDPSGKNLAQLQFRTRLRPQITERLPEKTQRLLRGADAFSLQAWMVDILPGKGAQPAQKVAAKFDPVDSSVVHLTAPEAPKDGRLRLWSLTLTPSPSLPAVEYDTDVAEWSTQRDDTVETAGRTLNIQALVDEVCRQRTQARTLPSSALLVTY